MGSSSLSAYSINFVIVYVYLFIMLFSEAHSRYDSSRRGGHPIQLTYLLYFLLFFLFLFKFKILYYFVVKIINNKCVS